MAGVNVDVIAPAVKRTVEDWPPLTPEQRDRLALLLRSAA